MSLQTPERFSLYVGIKTILRWTRQRFSVYFPAWLSLLCSDFFRFKPKWPMINFPCFVSTLNFPARMSFLNKMWTFPSKEEKQKEIISAWPALYQSLLVFLTYSEKKYPEYMYFGFFFLPPWIYLGTLYDWKES